jgi:uncharacterized protein (UPF0248 family)
MSLKKNRLAIIALILFLILFVNNLPARAQNVNFGLSITDGKVRGFYLSVSNYFNVPEARVLEIRERYRLADDELPVVFFLATHARVEPQVIIDLRLKGLSWWDITLRLGLNPEIFFVPVTVVKVGPPYGRAFGFYRQYREQKSWGKIVLTDVDVVNLVNLKFISEYHKIPPERVMEIRARGHNFVDVHETIVKEKGQGQSPKANSHAPKGKVRKK